MDVWNCVKYVEYVWKPMCEIWSKSIVIAPEQREWCIYLKPGQTSTMELFANIVNSQKPKGSTGF